MCVVSLSPQAVQALASPAQPTEAARQCPSMRGQSPCSHLGTARSLCVDGLGVCGSRAAGVDSGRKWPSSPVPWRRAHRQQSGQPPAHTQAAGIWALASGPLPARARLNALLAWPDVRQALDRASQSGAGPVGCQSPHSHPPPHLGQGHHMLSQGGWDRKANQGHMSSGSWTLDRHRGLPGGP